MRKHGTWTALQLSRALSKRSFASGSQFTSPTVIFKQKPPAAPSGLWDTLKLCGFTLGVVEGSFWLAGQARQQHWSWKQKGWKSLLSCGARAASTLPLRTHCNAFNSDSQAETNAECSFKHEIAPHTCLLTLVKGVLPRNSSFCRRLAVTHVLHWPFSSYCML